MKKNIQCITMFWDMNMEGVAGLVWRNQSIYQNIGDPSSIDIIIFHRGIVSEKTRREILEATPRLRIAMVDISRNDQPPASFWLSGFWKHVRQYDYMLRLGTNVEFNIGRLFKTLEEACIISSTDMTPMPDDETLGLNEVSMRCFHRMNPTRKYPASGPDMSVFGLNLKKLRDHLHLKRFFQCIEASRGIYDQGWSERSLWGEVITYLFHEEGQFQVVSIAPDPPEVKAFVHRFRIKWENRHRNV